jgi:hypothetical protein
LPDVGVDHAVDALELVEAADRGARPGGTVTWLVLAKVSGSRKKSWSLPSVMIRRRPSKHRPQPSPS